MLAALLLMSQLTTSNVAACAEHPAEWNIGAGISKSVNLFESTAGRNYAVQTVTFSKSLGPEMGPGIVRGCFAWGIEAMPMFLQFHPDTIYGAGVAPAVWRWNLVPHERWSAFAELAMGGLWTSAPIPDKTSRLNFSAHWGAGIRLRPHGANAWLLAYRFQHFSNGNQFNTNPGVNSHVFLAGWSHR